MTKKQIIAVILVLSFLFIGTVEARTENSNSTEKTKKMVKAEKRKMMRACQISKNNSIKNASSDYKTEAKRIRAEYRIELKNLKTTKRAGLKTATDEASRTTVREAYKTAVKTLMTTKNEGLKSAIKTRQEAKTMAGQTYEICKSATTTVN